MSQLLVFGVDSPQTAEKVLDLAGDLAKQQLLELADAAWVERTMDGKVKLHQSVNLTAMMAGSGAVTGALWGTLIGLLFLNPLAGAAVGAGVGAGTGAITGSLTDIGVNDDLIRQIGETLEPGKAAVFFLARNATVDRVIDAIKPYKPEGDSNQPEPGQRTRADRGSAARPAAGWRLEPTAARKQLTAGRLIA